MNQNVYNGNIPDIKSLNIGNVALPSFASNNIQLPTIQGASSGIPHIPQIPKINDTSSKKATAKTTTPKKTSPKTSPKTTITKSSELTALPMLPPLGSSALSTPPPLPSFETQLTALSGNMLPPRGSSSIDMHKLPTIPHIAGSATDQTPMLPDISTALNTSSPIPNTSNMVPSFLQHTALANIGGSSGGGSSSGESTITMLPSGISLPDILTRPGLSSTTRSPPSLSDVVDSNTSKVPKKRGPRTTKAKAAISVSSLQDLTDITTTATTTSPSPKTRVGVRWTAAEDEKLLQAVLNGEEFETVAKDHQRTPTAIKARIIGHIYTEMELGGLNIEEASKKYRISVEDIEQYKPTTKAPAKSKATSSNNTDQVANNAMSAELLTEIRDLLRTMVANQEKILSINMNR